MNAYISIFVNLELGLIIKRPNIRSHFLYLDILDCECCLNLGLNGLETRKGWDFARLWILYINREIQQKTGISDTYPVTFTINSN